MSILVMICCIVVVGLVAFNQGFRKGQSISPPREVELLRQMTVECRKLAANALRLVKSLEAERRAVHHLMEQRDMLREQNEIMQLELEDRRNL